MTSVGQEYHLPPTLFPDTDGTSDDSWAHDLVWPIRTCPPFCINDWFKVDYIIPLQWGSTVNQPSTFAWDTVKNHPFSLTGLETVRLWVWSFWQPVCLPQKQTEGDEVSCDVLVWGSTSSQDLQSPSWTYSVSRAGIFTFIYFYFFGLSQSEPFFSITERVLTDARWLLGWFIFHVGNSCYLEKGEGNPKKL